MNRTEQGLTVASLLQNFAPTQPFVTTRSSQAKKHLRDAFEEGRSLAILNGGWAAGSKQVVRGFLDELDELVSVARISDTSSSELDGMRELIRSIGFDPKDLPATDLHLIFEKFLGYQKMRKRRTVVVLEDSVINGDWVRDYLARLVDLEAKGLYGLTVVLMRFSKFNEPADNKSLDPASYKAGKHISLTPFTQNETREFVRWRINVEESADLGRILDFAAVTLIHELCDGIPDAIECLCCSALELADDEDTAPVTTDIVMRASQALKLRPMSDQPTSNTRLAVASEKSIPTLQLPKAPKIVLTHNGEKIRELPFTQQRISIGRSTENDVCIDSPFVSRQHATIFRNGAETAVVDLDSKNGTFVNSRRIQVQTIADKDEITIGHHSIRFHDPDAPRIRSLNGIGRGSNQVHKNSSRTQSVRTTTKSDTARN